MTRKTGAGCAVELTCDRRLRSALSLLSIVAILRECSLGVDIRTVQKTPEDHVPSRQAPGLHGHSDKHCPRPGRPTLGCGEARASHRRWGWAWARAPTGPASRPLATPSARHGHRLGAYKPRMLRLTSRLANGRAPSRQP